MSIPRGRAIVLVAAAFIVAACGGNPPAAPRLYAAASLAPAVERLPQAGAPPFLPVLGGTPLIVQGIRAGAAPGVLVAANVAWADALEADGHVAPGSRLDLLGGRLVVIVPEDSGTAIASLDGLAGPAVERIALAEPDSVPVGSYARAALRSAGIWEEVEGRVVATADARAVVALVVRGEVDAGIAYATDAGTAGVRSVLDVPPELHPPIRYPLLLVRDAPPAARELWEWLQRDAAARVFEEAGFERLPR